MVRVNMGEPIWEPAKIPFSANKFEKNYILRTPIQTVLCGGGINGKSSLCSASR